MIVAFSGASCVGKTTLINELQKDSRFSRFWFGLRTVRNLADRGVKINELGDDETQLFVMNTHKQNILREGDKIVDRCMLDGMSYARVQLQSGKISTDTYEYCLRMYLRYISQYDYIFYMPPEFDIIPDGVRPTDPNFRNKAVESFEHFINDGAEKNVIILRGSVENRLQKIYETLGV